VIRADQVAQAINQLLIREPTNFTQPDQRLVSLYPPNKTQHLYHAVSNPL
jgi:hypothetical protein